MSTATHPQARTSAGPGHQIVAEDVAQVGFYEESKRFLGSEDLPKERYYSPEFYRLEVERMWTRVWLMACREDELAETGDSIVFDLADYSLLVVRSGPGEIRAFHNACLHRGTQLCPRDGHVEEIVCPFHGWTYGLDGALKWMPGGWDFPHVDQASVRLPQVRVDTWGGFVFVNIDGNAPPLLDYLGVVPDHFRASQYEDRHKVLHLTKIIPANWKVAFAAFAESYHIPFTHPQFCQYPNRLYYTTQFPGRITPTKDAMADIYGGHVLGRVAIRDAVERQREGGDAITPTEALTNGRLAAASITYWVFPNFSVWAGNLPFVYRVLPYKNEVEMSVMDVMMFIPKPPGVDLPAAERAVYGPDEPLRGTSPLGEAGFAFDQDFRNMEQMQRGLHAMVKPGVTLANFQEGLIRNHDQLLTRYIETS